MRKALDRMGFKNQFYAEYSLHEISQAHDCFKGIYMQHFQDGASVVEKSHAPPLLFQVEVSVVEKNIFACGAFLLFQVPISLNCPKFSPRVPFIL